MDHAMEQKLSRFAENRKAIKASGFLMDPRIAAACACLFALNDRSVTTEEIKDAKALLKSKVGIFSNFRGYTQTAITCMLAGSRNAEWLMTQSLEAYACLKKKFFFAEYLPMAAVMAAQSVPASRFDAIAERTHRIYKLMQKDHPLLTGQEDELMCMILALQDVPEEQQAANCETCYQLLKGQLGIFASGDGIQSLSAVLAAANGNLEENSRRAISLYQYFKEHGSSISNGYTLGALGALAILPVPIEQLGEQVLAISEALKTQRGYNFLQLDRKTRMVHAMLLAASAYTEGSSGVVAAIQGTISAIIAEEIMIMCMITAQAASNSSNN